MSKAKESEALQLIPHLMKVVIFLDFRLSQESYCTMLEEYRCSIIENVDKGTLGLYTVCISLERLTYISMGKWKDFIQLWEIYMNVIKDGYVSFT